MTAPENPPVTTERRGSVAVVTIERPERRNVH